MIPKAWKARLMIRVLVVDDHLVVREGIKRILAETSDLRVVAEASDGREGYLRATAQAVDAVLLDLALPGRGGLEVLQQIKQARPQVPVLVFSMHPEQQFAIRAFKAGAAGYLPKDSLVEDLVPAIRKVACGGRYVSQALAEYLVHEMTGDHVTPRHALLSNREYQVLCLLASGGTVSEVAEALTLSVKTISTYRARILDKLHLKTTAELIHYAACHRLVA